MLKKSPTTEGDKRRAEYSSNFIVALHSSLVNFLIEMFEDTTKG